MVSLETVRPFFAFGPDRFAELAGSGQAGPWPAVAHRPWRGPGNRAPAPIAGDGSDGRKPPRQLMIPITGVWCLLHLEGVPQRPGIGIFFGSPGVFPDTPPAQTGMARRGIVSKGTSRPCARTQFWQAAEAPNISGKTPESFTCLLVLLRRQRSRPQKVPKAASCARGTSP